MKCAYCNYTPRHKRYEPLAHDYCSSPTPTQGYSIAMEFSAPSSECVQRAKWFYLAGLTHCSKQQQKSWCSLRRDEMIVSSQ